MENCSPVLPSPGKSRRSYCPSEYESAGEGDISDASLYYSIIDDGNMSMNMSMNKENTTNGSRRSMADLNASAGYRGSKIATPLLRKVLIDPSNKTPRNKNNKRVSFSQSPKPNPMPEISGKMAKMQLKESEETIHLSVNGMSERKRIPLTPGKLLKNRLLDKISETVANDNTSKAALTVDNVSKHSNEQQDCNLKMENGDSQFVLNSTASTDDIEKDQMQNTIIENLNDQDGDQTLISLDIATTVPAVPIAIDIVSNGKKPTDGQSKSIIEKNQSPTVESTVSKSDAHAKLAESVTAAMSSKKNDRKKSMIPSSSTVPPNTPNKMITKSVAEVLKEMNSVASLSVTKNATKMNRAQLANDTRKSILPVARKQSRPTVQKRRSATFETRKIDRRATMARMSMVKSVASRKSVMPSTGIPLVDKTVATKPIVPRPAETTKKTSNLTTQMKKPSTTVGPTAPVDNVASTVPREPLHKPRSSSRLTTARLSIYTTRPPPPSTMNARSQANNSNNSTMFTTAPPSMPSTSFGSSVKKEVFVKPTLPRPLNNKQSKIIESKLPTANASTLKCKYCDRTFAKPFGLNQHLADNCEKIPASHRRLLLKHETDKAESKTRKHDLDKHFQSQRQNDAWKHSRFFVEKFNQAVSVSHTATKSMESGLNCLRHELKLLSNAHSGVTRTPKKTIKCHICNKIFWDCVEYAIHKSNHAAEQQLQQQQDELQQLQSQY